MATVWASHTLLPRPFQSEPKDLRKFFCTFNELELHPLIWVVLVRSALAVNSSYHCFQVDGSSEDLSGQDYAHIISLFLPASRVHDRLHEPLLGWSRTVGSSTVTLSVALTYHLGDISESVQACLLHMLSFMDDSLSPTLPPRYRLLYKAGKYALHYLADELCASHTDVGSCRHLQLLTDVLRILRSEYNTILEAYTCFLTPIFDLLCTVIEKTSICDYNATCWQHSKLHDLLSDSLSAIIHLSTKFTSSCQPEFTSPSFHRLLQVPAYHLSRWQHPFPLRLYTVRLMEKALAVGNEAMYRAVIDSGCMWILSEITIADYDNHDADFLHSSRALFAFIRGLQALSSASAHEFFEYLHQPRNFIITFIVIASSNWGPKSPSLLELCPKDSSWWDTHRATLDGIINWCQASNRDGLPFPLENFFNGKVVQMDNRAVSLDEALLEMFAQDRYQRKFEWAARTIILGEEAPSESEIRVEHR
ncbi:hypothetical protein BDZ89DRAFT_617827 [Hymenopellis radicata]|nr:hypothetical protein BDZ89DRAFT_617827 [Hymenopellis radicata]